MSNLFEMRCPRCGDDDHIDIAATVWLRLVPDGTDADASKIGDQDYTLDSPTLCAACDFHGTMRQFWPNGGAR